MTGPGIGVRVYLACGVTDKTDALSRLINALRERRGVNRTIVAVANKNARIIWAMLRKGMEFQPNA